jgi:hypothetical protein
MASSCRRNEDKYDRDSLYKPPPRRTKHLMNPRLMIIRTAIFAAAAIALLQMGALAQSGKMHRVGLVSVGAPDSGILGPGMVQDFAKRGYAVDRTPTACPPLSMSWWPIASI